MKLSQSFFYTLRNDAKDEDSVSSNLLVRAGMIKKSSNGTYMMMPMGKRVLAKIENIVREEMDAKGAQELLMPALIPEEVYVKSGRREAFGKNMFSLKDRYNRPYVLGPTHEELFVLAASMKGTSYKDYPFNLYQIQTKYRDEPRPRYGLIRVREFIMKDAYTFDIDEKGLDVSYQKMYDAYCRIFDRLGLKYKIVKADTGAMGGLLSEEYQAISSIGEDVVVTCSHCDFASNLEISEVISPEPVVDEVQRVYEKVATPNAKTIEEVAAFFHQPAHHFVKTLIYVADGRPVAFCLPGDRELNETKARKCLGVSELELADSQTVEKVTKAPVGFAGPIGLDCDIYLDRLVLTMSDFIVGANEKDAHYHHVHQKDIDAKLITDLSQVKAGDVCPHCGHELVFEHGIEVGNLFKLGTKYAKSMDLFYTDQSNQLHPVWMGSYGIGLERCMAAVADQSHDEHGLIWPVEIAPFKVALVQISDKDEAQVALASQLYDQFPELLWDDRSERPGVKFKDMELIGVPYRVTVGRDAAKGFVEWSERASLSKESISVEEAIARLKKLFS